MTEHPHLARLGGFAAGHFGFSIACCLLMYSGLTLLSSIEPYWSGFWNVLCYIIPVALMAAYFPLGLLLGATAPWARVNTRREMLLSILTQAGIAWCWAALVLVGLFGPEPVILALSQFLFSTLFLAFPSCLFVVFCAGMLWPFWDAELAVTILAAFFAGLLPPLLYNLGNFLATRRIARKPS